jgi:hypothetical protein
MAPALPCTCTRSSAAAADHRQTVVKNIVSRFLTQLLLKTSRSSIADDHRGFLPSFLSYNMNSSASKQANCFSSYTLSTDFFWERWVCMINRKEEEEANYLWERFIDPTSHDQKRGLCLVAISVRSQILLVAAAAWWILRCCSLAAAAAADVVSIDSCSSSSTCFFREFVR